MHANLRKLIFGAPVSGMAFCTISAMPVSASDIMHNTHARLGQLSRIWEFYDCKLHTPIGNTGSYGERGTVTVKFVPRTTAARKSRPMRFGMFPPPDSKDSTR
jgi:hypothetical protein